MCVYAILTSERVRKICVCFYVYGEEDIVLIELVFMYRKFISKVSIYLGEKDYFMRLDVSEFLI